MVMNAVMAIAIQITMSYFAEAWWRAQTKNMGKKGGKDDWDEEDWGKKD